MAYRIVTIPKLDEKISEHNQLALAHKFRNFRLHALKTAPGAFASSYEDEAKCGLDHTFERLRHAKATQFVALACNASIPNTKHVCEAGSDELLNHDWLGIIVLISLEGGLNGVSAKADPFSQIANKASQSEAAHATQNNNRMHFHLNGTFVSQSARRRGVGKRLIEVALDTARSVSNRRNDGFHCTIIVDEWNHAAIKLYERVGFEVVAKETYGEDRIAVRMELSRFGAAAAAAAAAAEVATCEGEEARKAISQDNNDTAL